MGRSELEPNSENGRTGGHLGHQDGSFVWCGVAHVTGTALRDTHEMQTTNKTIDRGPGAIVFR